MPIRLAAMTIAIDLAAKGRYKFASWVKTRCLTWHNFFEPFMIMALAGKVAGDTCCYAWSYTLWWRMLANAVALLLSAPLVILSQS